MTHLMRNSLNPPTFYMRRVPRVRLLAWLFGGVLAALGLVAAPAQADELPLVVSATVNYMQKTLTISGQNFGLIGARTDDRDFKS